MGQIQENSLHGLGFRVGDVMNVSRRAYGRYLNVLRWARERD